MKFIDLIIHASFQHFFLALIIIIGGTLVMISHPELKEILASLITLAVGYYYGRSANGNGHTNGTNGK